MHYPPAGTYVFRYSLSSGPGDWKKSKAYRSGIGWNNPLLPISVADEITSKSLPSSQSFCKFKQDNLVLGTLKRADLGPSILLRAYEIEGSPVQTPVEFLGSNRRVRTVNLLEEQTGTVDEAVWHLKPYEIGTVRLSTK